MTSDDKRSALKRRITAAQHRIEANPASEYARDAANAAYDFARKNPIALIGGAAVLGLALGSLSKRGRKTATATGLLGRFATDAAVAFALAIYGRASQRPDDASEGEAKPELTDRSE